MTEDEAHALVARMYRRAWVVGVLGLVTNLMCLTYLLVWTSMWWLAPVSMVALAYIAHGMHGLINPSRENRP